MKTILAFLAGCFFILGLLDVFETEPVTIIRTEYVTVHPDRYRRIVLPDTVENITFLGCFFGEGKPLFGHVEESVLFVGDDECLRVAGGLIVITPPRPWKPGDIYLADPNRKETADE